MIQDVTYSIYIKSVIEAVTLNENQRINYPIR
jgi:hypothetical protein